MMSDSPHTFTPEQALLVCCARTHPDPQTTRHIGALLEHPLDWPALTELAFQHRVMPLLYRSLQATHPDRVPPAVFADLRDYYHGNALRNQFLLAELLGLLEFLGQHGAPAIPFKGPVLAAAVYQDVALRQFSDFDLLFDKADVLTASDLLLAHGYHPKDGTTNKGRLWRGYHVTLERDDGHVIVELHWRVKEPHFAFNLDTRALRASAQTTSLQGHTITTLAPEDLLLILCVHGAKHLWERLSWVCDVAELVRQHASMDWLCVLRRARHTGSTRMLRLGLALAHELLDADLPAAVRDEVYADSRVRPLAAALQARLFAAPQGSSQIRSSQVTAYRFYVDMRERFRDRVWLYPYLVRFAAVHRVRGLGRRVINLIGTAKKRLVRFFTPTS